MWPQLPVDNRQVKIQPPSQQWAITDKVEQLCQGFLDLHAVIKINAAQTMYTNGVTGQGSRALEPQVQRLTTQDTVAPHLDGTNGNRLCGTQVDTGGFAINNHHFVSSVGIE